MLISKNFFRIFRVILPCFRFYNYRYRVCSFEGMVGSSRNPYTGRVTASGHYYHFRFTALLIVEAFDSGAVDAYHYFTGVTMPVNSGFGTGQQHVHHALAVLVGTVALVEVHTETGRLFCLECHLFKKCFIEFH